MRIKTITHQFIVGLCFLFFCQEAKAQVNLHDSLTLVAVYNAIPALHSDTTWLRGNVSTWNGVYVQNNNVYSLDVHVLISGPMISEVCGFDSLLFLSFNGCDLRGLVPKCIFEMPSLRVLSFNGNSIEGIEAGADLSKMTSIESINLNWNEFEEMPDFMSIANPNFNYLGVAYNRLNFDDLIPMLSKPISTYEYSPQRQILPWRGFVVQAGDSANFPDVSVVAGDSNNTYQWKQQIGDSSFIVNSPRLKNINQSMMRVEGADASDGGTYLCEMTNPNLPGLILNSGFIAMTVITPQPQTIIFLSSRTIYCYFNNFLEALTTGPAGRGVSFISLDTSIATINSDNSLNLFKRGVLPIRVTAPADTLHLADTAFVYLLVASYYSPPVVEITKELASGEGKDLYLSVPYEGHLTYQWTTPNGQIYDTAAITISPFTPVEFGNYKISVKEGNCPVSDLSMRINSLIYGTPVVYELLTPNGDGDNETFYIGDLNPALHNEVSIFNASHQIVFHEENYRNNWNGENLPVGTYYYIVRIGENTYKGNLYIKR